MFKSLDVQTLRLVIVESVPAWEEPGAGGRLVQVLVQGRIPDTSGAQSMKGMYICNLDQAKSTSKGILLADVQAAGGDAVRRRRA